MPYILTIRERNNSWAGRPPVTTTHNSRTDAEAELLDYVRRNWDAELGTEPPGDAQQMIEEYFADVLEAFEITEQVGKLDAQRK
jgi:hypothetical protein